MYKNKFNPENASDITPFAYVEETTKINKTIDGAEVEKFHVISFGAFEEYSHRAPELGGVAIVHKHPEVIIGIKYIPWNIEGRSVEHKAIVERIENGGMSNQVLYEFLTSVGYDILAEGEADREAYMEEKLHKMTAPKEEEVIVEEVTPKEYLKNKPKRKKEVSSIKYYKGEEIISLD